MSRRSLQREKDRLAQLKHQLSRSLNVLRRRLVCIYRSDSPDVLTVMLEADGFDDLVSRYEYLRRIEEQDAAIEARDLTVAAVEIEARHPQPGRRPS